MGAGLIDASHIYIEPCSEGAFTADRNGKHLYAMPHFKFWDLASNKSETRFAVFERGRSFLHEFGQGTYDRLRVIVYRTDTGEKLFERKWSASATEHPVFEGVALSDDGSVVYLCREGGSPLSFSLSGSKSP